jgi:ATP synthase protein I
MPKPDKSRKEAPGSLDARLDAFEAGRAPKTMSGDVHLAMGQGYRFVGEVVGGVFGGVGLGWLFDRIAHSQPWGLIGGLLIGTGAAIFVAVRGAARMAKQALAEAGPLPSVPDDEDND